MKFFRLLIIFLVSVVAVIAIFTFVLPTHQTIQKSIVLHSSDTVIYRQLKHLRNVEKLTVWGRQDSTVVYTYSSKDDTIGSVSAWKGNPFLSGEGKITIVDIVPYQMIKYAILFNTPKKGKATSSFHLQPLEKNQTSVTWQFSLATPRPWNIFNLFASLDEKMGDDFEKGLQVLKKMVETQNNVTDSVAINTTNQ